MVRRGAKHDGGYLIPASSKADLLISFGLGNDWKFELDLIRYGHVKQFIVFDHSQNLRRYFITFRKRFNLKNFNLMALFYRFIILNRYLRDFIISNNVHIQKKITLNGNLEKSFSDLNEISVTEVFKEFANSLDTKVILKVDIEGDEFDIIDQVLNHKNQITILIIEYHDITQKQEEMKKNLVKLKSVFTLIHSHVNNYGTLNSFGIPQMCEFTFINKAYFIGDVKIDKLPRQGLDYATTPFREDYNLIFRE